MGIGLKRREGRSREIQVRGNCGEDIHDDDYNDNF